ncbi:MAG TPA: transcription termination factor NusA [Acidobacteriota bacterium]|nr:transcription termination factor NusA [Acidobacteriota bacterium]
MANTLGQTIEQLSKEKGIDPEIVYTALEDAMVAAARRYFKTEEELQAAIDRETGHIEVFAVKKIVEKVEDPTTEMSLEEALEIDPTFEVGDYVEIPKRIDDFGRIAAQTAKQVIVQKVREAEREIIFEEFRDQIGNVVTGIVRRTEAGRDVILDIGKTEALLPYSQQCRNETYMPGDRLRAVIIEVHRQAKGPQIILSRSHPSLLVRLFEAEIPEVYDGTVIIKNAVREGGERAKVAVASKDPSIDPVGACVGMRGSRINSIIRELRGEKIDIIHYSDDIVEYTINALSPARVSRVLVVDPEKKILEVIVPEDQLSLAIGRKGQNVRLASKLLGWEINVKSQAEKKLEILNRMEKPARETESAEEREPIPVAQLPGVGEAVQARLEEAGIVTVQQLAAVSLEDLVSIQGIGEKTAERLKQSAQLLLAAPASALEEVQSTREGETEEPIEKYVDDRPPGLEPPDDQGETIARTESDSPKESVEETAQTVLVSRTVAGESSEGDAAASLAADAEPAAVKTRSEE